MICGFAECILIAGVFPLIGMMGIVDNISLVHDFYRMNHRSIRQTADGSRYQKFFTGCQNVVADMFIFDGAQSNGQKLVRPQGVIR